MSLRNSAQTFISPCKIYFPSLSNTNSCSKLISPFFFLLLQSSSVPSCCIKKFQSWCPPLVPDRLGGARLPHHTPWEWCAGIWSRRMSCSFTKRKNHSL